MNIIKTNQKINFVIALILFIIFLSSCEKDQQEQVPNRLILVYMIADNDLDYFAIRNINDLERGFHTTTNGF